MHDLGHEQSGGDRQRNWGIWSGGGKGGEIGTTVIA